MQKGAKSLKLLKQLDEHLRDMNVAWHLCGGFAIDLFLGKETRKHKDLDITVSFDDMEVCIDYLKSKGWRIIAPVGEGRCVPVEYALSSNTLYFDNIWCYREGAEFIKTLSVEGHYQYLEMVDRVQEDLDFIEVLFNKVEKGTFYYLKNTEIHREIDKAFVEIENISVLSPEIILLYKTRNPGNADYRQDFSLAVAELQQDSRKWLEEAMKTEYPEGHPWGVK